MSFFMLPPEITSARMFSGAGSGPMLEAAAAWRSLATELDSAAESFSTLTSGLTAQAWQGPAAQAMAAAAAPYANYLATAAVQAVGTSTQAQAVAGAFESALAATVHPALISANRSNLVSLVLSNLFGQNAPAIAAVESLYEEMWAADVTAMLGYHANAAAAVAQLISPAASALPSFGYGNIGEGNIGFFNTGTLNFGLNNVSPFFTPTDPITTFGGFGIANNGTELVGAFNTGNQNVGIANNGVFNIGIANTGTYNSGLPISLLTALGVGNQGNWNQGFFNTGNHNLGIGLVGDNLIGIGPLHINAANLPSLPSFPSLPSLPSILPAASVLPSFGYGNIGEGNIGFFNTGTLNFGLNNVSPFFTPTDPITTFGGFGIANNGTELVGAFNTGNQNVGIANNGVFNIGIANTGTYNSGLPISLLTALGVGNQGNWNQGFFNTGNHNLGIGLVGDNLIGIGPLHINR
ncbi:PPE family protein [Mycobacterium asiaticum]|uniref:PPE domain-containing protein n=1 Tax=Mycobacterium asiaticum TaxID=1790 RepID=A0A1A3N6A4_MYCAS|nr:PPE family protein [Mycobacterium asiaticum]OBK15902.1 hypothetical protein A5636_00560 [Mycobacterium asiaticum]